MNFIRLATMKIRFSCKKVLHLKFGIIILLVSETNRYGPLLLFYSTGSVEGRFVSHHWRINVSRQVVKPFLAIREWHKARKPQA
jgi:hypothetical protein